MTARATQTVELSCNRKAAVVSMASGGARQQRVALVGHEFRDYGGMDRAVAELLRRASNEVHFHVLSTELGETLRPLVTWHRLRVPRRPFPLRYFAFYIVAGLRLVRLKVDLIHTLGAIVPNRVDVATVHACHAGFVRATGRLAPTGAPILRTLNTSISRVLSLAAERWTYRPTHVRTVAAVSGGVLNEIERDYPGVRVEITPNGVDTNRFQPDKKARARLRGNEDLDDSHYVALFVGGNWDHKGLAVVIESIARASAMGAHIDRLWIVGAGDVRRFRQIAARHGVGERVRFFGPRDDVERFYQAADFFVLPSLYEAFSLVLLEAAASGLPIITTAVSGVEELNSIDQTVCVVERTPESVAEALVVLRANQYLGVELARAARARALTYTWERSVESVLRIYRELAGQSAAVNA